MGFFHLDGRLKIGPSPSTSKSTSAVIDVASVADPAEGPVYIYDLDDIQLRADALQQALDGLAHRVHYAMKANSHHEILKLFARRGFGVDTVSGGEISKALAAGVPADQIVFSGVAKTKTEIALAVRKQIKQINVESPQELERIGQIATELNTTADVAFRINPDVNPQTHPYITTGFRENKFGMDESFFEELVSILAQYPSRLRLRGLTMHIGSLLFDLDVIREAIEKTIRVHKRFESQGHRLDRLDIGGGLGIRYETADASEEFALIKAYGKMVKEAVNGLDVELLIEPGRILVARSGLLVSEVQYLKFSGEKRFVILNTGMHHLLRPALYGAKHRILHVIERATGPFQYDVVGPICESSDFLAKGVSLSEVQPGDLLAIADAGAYGFVMASHYNSHGLPREICVSEGLVV